MKIFYANYVKISRSTVAFGRYCFFLFDNSMCIVNNMLMCMFGVQKVIRPKPGLRDCLFWPCNVCILTTKWLTFLGVELSACIAEKWVWFTCHWKQKVWVSTSVMWLQVVMSVSRCMLFHNVWTLVVKFNTLVIVVTSVFPKLKYQLVILHAV